MKKIKLHNPQDLNNKKSKKIFGKIFMGIISAAGIATLLTGVNAQLKYNKALSEATKSGRPQEIAELVDEDKKNEIAKYFADAIRKNTNLTEEQKEKIIRSFTEYVINEWGQLFNEQTIANMYAVASTERVRTMSDFAQEHAWWSGDYSSLFNLYTTDETSESIHAHEQLHGITKGDISTIGLSRYIGIGVNEGMTSIFSDRKSYDDLRYYCSRISAIIGADKFAEFYLNHNQEGLIEELNNYLTPKETKQLLKAMDRYTYIGYADTFFLINLNKDVMQEQYDKCNEEILTLLDKMKENAKNNGMKISLSKCLTNYEILRENIDWIYRRRYSRTNS